MKNEHAKMVLSFLNDACDRIDRGERVARPSRGWWRVGAAASMALGLALGAAACGSDSSDGAGAGDAIADDNNEDSTDSAAKADGVNYPMGSYENRNGGPVQLLVLSPGKLFSYIDQSDVETKGKYTFTKSGSTRYLKLVDEAGKIAGRFAWKLSGNTLQLRWTGDTLWHQYKRLTEDCGNSVDDDKDGATDCGDLDCSSACFGARYGIPMEVDFTDGCKDNIDNDGDGKSDCDDPDCAGGSDCTAGVKYAIPYETDCGNSADDDADGKTDCADSDCSRLCTGARYGIIPFESDCHDQVDNDDDGATDCLDSQCAGDPTCVGIRYGIPQV